MDSASPQQCRWVSRTCCHGLGALSLGCLLHHLHDSCAGNPPHPGREGQRPLYFLVSTECNRIWRACVCRCRGAQFWWVLTWFFRIELTVPTDRAFEWLLIKARRYVDTLPQVTRFTYWLQIFLIFFLYILAISLPVTLPTRILRPGHPSCQVFDRMHYYSVCCLMHESNTARSQKWCLSKTSFFFSPLFSRNIFL